jgi:hypothetical protein
MKIKLSVSLAALAFFPVFAAAVVPEGRPAPGSRELEIPEVVPAGEAGR